MHRGPSIITKLSVFAEWFDDKDTWYTRKQLAAIVGCAESSIGAAFGWLRGNGFTITSFWVRSERRYLYNVRKGEADKISNQARRTLKELSVTRRELKVKVKG